MALLAAALAGCHAHGASGLDHGVTVSFTRSPADLSTVQLSFQNNSPDPVCLGSGSFQPAAFVVKSGQTVENSSAAAAPAAACIPLPAGGHLSQSVAVGQGHSRYEMQTGSVCYNYGFDPATPGAWHAAGQICE
jgi:hypothetical protein